MEQFTYVGQGERVDSYVSTFFGYSRNFFHHVFERGGIHVNGKIAKKSLKLKSGDTIQIDDVKRYLEPEMMEDAPIIEIPVVLDKPDYLVINKPKGVLSHPSSIRDIASPSVVGWLYHRYKTLPSVGHFIRAGLIHRLDKDTDGLMIVAKTEKGLQHFKTLFHQKSEAETIKEKELIPLKKYYRAICKITPPGQLFLDKISLPYILIEDVVPKTPHPLVKEGITKILSREPQEKSDALILLEILTGRTHQIRFHLSHHGLPIIGDYLYGKEDPRNLQLTAWKLEFLDPEGEMIMVSV